MSEKNISKTEGNDTGESEGNGPNKFSIEIGIFSIKSEGKPAVLMSQLVKEQFPELVKSIEKHSMQELIKTISPLAKDLAPQIFTLINSYLNRSATSAPRETVSTDAKVPADNNITGKTSGTA